MKLKQLVTIIPAVLVITFLVGALPAQAQFEIFLKGIGTVVPQVVFESNPVLVTNASLLTKDSIQRSILEIAFELLKKRIFDMMVDQIIDYINGNGKPQFITDWRGFLETAGDAAVGDIVKQIGLGQLCSPNLSLRIRLAMVAPPRFSKQISCTLTSIVKNIENFQRDFRRGGFLAYQELWAPNNNFYGSLLLAWNAKIEETVARKEAARNEALASRGFLSVKKCTPAQTRTVRSVDEIREFDPDFDRRYSAAGRKDFEDSFAKGAEISYGTDEKCTVVTPGTVAGDLVSKAVGADLDYIINSKDLAVYVSAIADALLNRLIRAGVEGLSGVQTPDAPRRGSFAGTSCEFFSDRAKQDCLNYQKRSAERRKTVRSAPGSASPATPAQIDNALQPRLQAQQIIQNLISLEDQVLANATLWRNCQTSKGQQTLESAALLEQHQRQRDAYLQAKTANEEVVKNLSAAKNSSATDLSEEDLDIDSARSLLGEQQRQLSAAQTAITQINADLQTKITLCQQS